MSLSVSLSLSLSLSDFKRRQRRIMSRHDLPGDSEHAGEVGEGRIDETRGAAHSHSEASSSESAPLGGQFKLELPDTIPAARRQGEEKPEGEWRAFRPSLAGVAAAPQEVDEQGGGGARQGQRPR
jgi:hypothetical protein